MSYGLGERRRRVVRRLRRLSDLGYLDQTIPPNCPNPRIVTFNHGRRNEKTVVFCRKAGRTARAKLRRFPNGRRRTRPGQREMALIMRDPRTGLFRPFRRLSTQQQAAIARIRARVGLSPFPRGVRRRTLPMW